MRVGRITIASAFLLIGPAMGESGKAAAPAAPGLSPPDCWVEHTQVQPSPTARERRTAQQLASAQEPLFVEEHVGSEHPKGPRMRSCASQPESPPANLRAPQVNALPEAGPRP
jgi:hypothetical protein